MGWGYWCGNPYITGYRTSGLESDTDRYGETEGTINNRFSIYAGKSCCFLIVFIKVRERTSDMDTLKVKDNMIIYSYRNGLKTSFCSDLIALVYNKPNIWLIFKNEEVLVHRSMIQMESVLQSNFTRINRQVIVNMYHVSEFIFKGGSYWIHLKNGLEYKISERREKAVREAFWLHANPNKV